MDLRLSTGIIRGEYVMTWDKYREILDKLSRYYDYNPKRNGYY